MPYLNLDTDYFDHPKTKRLGRLLGRGSEVLPLRVWVYAARYFSKDGRLTGISAQELEDECHWWGQPGEMVRVMLMPDVHFLEDDSGTLVVHDWTEHEGHIEAFKERAKAGAEERWKRYREANASSNAPSIAPSNPSSNAPTYLPTKPPKPTKEEPPAPPIPLTLDTEEFRQCLERWKRHRKEIHHPLKPTALEAHLRKCETIGVERSVIAMDHSIANGWQGMFEPDSRGSNHVPSAQSHTPGKALKVSL